MELLGEPSLELGHDHPVLPPLGRQQFVVNAAGQPPGEQAQCDQRGNQQRNRNNPEPFHGLVVRAV